ncbi:MAG: pyridoxamine 5'-phosphate oxidase family protein [Capsulimonas sp.]|uniref:pyridoxamine 5'-phosphate oxidase family protein n=1 Tax=Capsulimonas sp. TaxID=2494211 RepID=UPI0032645B6A
MSKQLDSIDEELAEWLRSQHVFFVATAPLSADGHVNCSPKGGDCFRILGPLEVVYQDYTGSGAETAAHVRENGRILLMFCGFEGKPNIARLHGQGELIAPGHTDYESLAALFPENPGTRAYVRVQVERVSTSCGFSVPFMDFLSHRDTLDKFALSKGPEGMDEYRAKKNAVSIDGLPALPLPTEQY